MPEGYRYADINRRVISVAIKELQEKADLVIQFQEFKRGRSVHSLRFTFVQNPQQSLAI